MKRTTIFALATLAALSVSATSIDAKPDAVAAWVGDSVPALYATSGDNPALRSFAHPYGLTILGIDYGTMRRDSIIAPQLGRGFDRYGVGASTYTRVGSDMVLEGHASYHRGTTRDVVWNETADIFMIYPYMAADSVGGDIQNEIYDFGGSYSDRRGRLLWGVSLDYTAGLHWRSRDPRPRNVTANLRTRAGIAWALSPKAIAGFAARYTRYKQTSSIKFESEMGQDKVYHLTGLGTQYQRFAGSGLSTHYNADLWGVSIDLRPDSIGGTGPSASFSYDGMNMNILLTDLKANENFKDLQVQLEGTENRISTARIKYNDAVMKYNVAIRRFPANIFAGLFGFNTMQGFQAEAGAQKAVTVSFDD